MNYTLSPAAQSDVKAIFRLNKELIDKYEDVGKINYAKVIKQVCKDIKEHIDEYRRIVCGGEIAGYMLVAERPEFTELEDLFLYPMFQNKGIGTAILRKILEESEKPIILRVFVKNEGALRLYTRLGFEISETVHETRYKMVYKSQKKGRCDNMSDNISKGRYGDFGGQYIPETLMNEIHKLEDAYERYSKDPEFIAELDKLNREYAGRPSLLYYAEKMTKDLGGAKIYFKREDLNHTGSHKINNVLGQCLLAKKMGKTRIIAETGAGQHGVAAATAAALMGLECEVFMGKEDTIRQALNVYRMELLGAKVTPVTTGTMTLKDAVNEAMRDWTTRVDDTLYVLGSVMGPHPFPMIVRDFQSVISREARAQILEREGKLPTAVMACVGGGSNAMGMFYNFINDKDVRLIGCEAAGRGVHTGETAATIATGTLGVFHGMKSLFCQNEYGQIAPVYSISAGLDYPGIGPEHAYLHEIGRAEYVPVTDDEAVNAFEYIARTEGIICAIESAHAVAHMMKIAPTMSKDDIIICCLSGRGDKDVAAIARYRGIDLHE